MLRLSICYLFLFLIQTITCGTPCVYDVGDGQTLDVRPLGNANGKGPKYDSIPTVNPVPYTFNWNACFSYSKSDGGTCKDAAACYSKNKSLTNL
jgi:hypothetical protein